MHRVFRPLAIFGVTSGMSAAALFTTGGALGGEPLIASVDAAPPLEAFSLGTGYYDLAELELLETTLYHVEESYVEPSRIDYEMMYVEALEAVEQRIPVCMFRREPGGSLLHLEVGTNRTVLEVPPIRTRKDLHRELKRVAAILKTLPIEDIPRNDEIEGEPHAQIEYALVNGVLGTLDPHSRLLPPEASQEMDVENQGEFGGLGITIIERDGRLTVEYPLPGTPAEKAGLQPSDQIVRIDGVSTINMSLDEAVGKLRGPIGSKVQIEVMREGLTEPMPIAITRASIKIKPVEGQLLDGGIGYVAIQGFHAKVEEDLTALLTRLDRESGGKLKGLILDLRDNPGGYLNQAEAVADIFLDHGTIVSQVDSVGKKLEVFEAHGSGQEPKYPIVVLVNSSSASASEIVAGALRNNERAVIVGERTYGKGSVQNLHPFFDGSKLKLTISKYLTPGDKSIQAVGIPADIELVPAIVEKKKDEKTGIEDNVALLYFSERVRREADSDKHLEQASVRIEDPAYTVHYLRPAEQKRRTSAALDLSGDFEVDFARDVLLGASSARRADILGGVAPVVSRFDREGLKDIQTAFTTLGIDWSEGSGVEQAKLEVRFDLGADDVLVAGEEETIALEVTNRGDKPLHRLSAVATFEGDYTPREFFFGRLAPGETRRYEQKVQLVKGHPTELTPVTFSFRDTTENEVATEHARLPVQGNPLPRLLWDVAYTDVGGGDGDGVAEVGEKLRIELTVENAGAGPTAEAFARIKNKSGRSIDITRGTIEPGKMVTKDGQACPVLEAGVDAGNVIGDPATANGRIERGDPPKYVEGCHRVVAPGETWTGSFEVLVKAAPSEGLELELGLGDAGAYDHASIVRAGFYDYFTEQQTLRVPIGAPLPEVPKSIPPVIQITRAPGIVVSGDRASLSGVVTDEGGIAHVEVYNGDDKVFFQGAVKGAHVRSVPFTADVQLEPGLNTLTVLATDETGYTDTSAVVTFWVAPEMAAQVGELPDMPELKRREN